MTTLRTFDPTETPNLIDARHITFVRVRDGEMEFARTKSEKGGWLMDLRSDDVIGAVWAGQYHTDVFALPDDP